MIKMSWMLTLKAALLPGASKEEWAIHLEDDKAAEIFIANVKGVGDAFLPNIETTYNIMNKFKDNAFGPGRLVISRKAGGKDWREKRAEVNERYAKIHKEIFPILEKRVGATKEKRSVGLKRGAEKKSARRAELVATFLDAANSLRQGEDVDWEVLNHELKSYFPGTARRGSAPHIRRFTKAITQENVATILEHMPEGHDKLEEVFGKLKGQTVANYRVGEIDTKKALEYIKTYGSKKKTSKGSIKALHLKELDRLQFGTGLTKKKWLNKLIIALMEGEETLDSFVLMDSWLRDIQSKFSIKEDEVLKTYLEQSWQKYQNPRHRADVGTAVVLEDVDEKEYKNMLQNQINAFDRFGEQSKDWEKYLDERKQAVRDISSGVTKDFKDFIVELHTALTIANPGTEQEKMKKHLTDLFPEEIDDFVDEMPKTDMHGFKQKSVPSPKVERRIGVYTLPPERDTYGKIVHELYDNMVGETGERKFSRLRGLFRKHKKQNPEFTREFHLEGISGGVTDSPYSDIVEQFGSKLERAVAYLTYDAYVAGESIHTLLKSKAAGRLRAADIDLVEVIRVLRIAQSQLAKPHKEIDSAVDTLHSKLDGVGEGKSTTQKKLEITKAEEPLFRQEIELLSKELNDSLATIKVALTEQVENKLRDIIQNQQDYANRTYSEIFSELASKGFIEGVNE
jgi:hypothetical protein